MVSKEYTAQKQREYRLRVKKLVFNHYSNDDPKCVYCNECDLSKLTIGHINDNGQEERKITGCGSKFYTWLKVNNFPNNGYEISCFSCNCGKRIGQSIKPIKQYVTPNSLLNNFNLIF